MTEPTPEGQGSPSGHDAAERSTPLLAARDIDKRYGSVVALRGASLEVHPGEIHALLGANGAGKSTLVKILAGVVPKDEGDIEVHGRRLEPRTPLESTRAGLATVFQDPALIADLTVSQNLQLVGLAPAAVREWLERLDLPNLDFERYVKDIPLPIQRLLDLSRALAQEPQLLLLDEITAALPGDDAERVFDVMFDLRERGRSVLFITHRLAEVLRTCDRATVLRDGIKAASLVPKDGDESQLVEAMLGEAAPQGDVSPRPTRATDAPVALEAEDLTARDHLKGASLRLRKGEILGLVALEGQGQDRLFDVLSGDRPFDGGRLLVAGEPVNPRSPYDMVRRGVVLVPSDRLHALLPQRSVRENLASALYNRVSRWFGLHKEEPARVSEAVERLQIDMRAQRQAQRLSGGNQQKVVVGRWLAAGFGTLLCFDPTRGIDIRTKEQIYALLRDLADDGAAILYYTSEFSEVPRVCDRVLVMYDGAITQELPVDADEATLLSGAHGLKEAST